MTTTEEMRSHAWLDSRVVRASDCILGMIALAAGTVALRVSPLSSLWDWLQSGADPQKIPIMLDPTIIAALLAVVGIALIVRGWDGSPPLRHWRLRDLLIIAAIIVAYLLMEARMTGFLRDNFGSPEMTAYYFLSLAVALAFARASRLRAAGMLLLGLLLAAIGMEPVSNQLRLTFGLEALGAGIPLLPAIVGLLFMADAILCLFSPSLFLAAYARQLGDRTAPAVPAVATLAMRFAAIVVLVLAYFGLQHAPFELGVAVLFGLFGIACRIFDWNRLILVFALAIARILENNIWYSLTGASGDPQFFLRRPVALSLLLLACGILAGIAVSGIRRRRAEAALP